MSIDTKTDLADLLARRAENHSLEAPFYVSPDVFSADMEMIFGRHWIYVGVEPDVPEAGDVWVVDIGRHSIAIVRGDDGEVRAFHNVCRHRGAKIVLEEKSTVGNLVCRYHSWTYDLEGKLIHAAHMGEGFDHTCHGLRPVHLKSLEGLLFVCLADEPPTDFDDMAEVMAPYIAPHRIRDTKIAAVAELIEPGNWKLTMENNRECYHCAPNHPELTVPLFAYGFGYAPGELEPAELAAAAEHDAAMAKKHAEWEACGLPSKLVEHLDDRITGFRTMRLILDGAGESHTLDSKVACRKLLGDFGENQKAIGALHFWTQPNSWHHFMSDHIVTFSAIPLDERRTLVRTKWLVHKDAVEGVDYDLKNLTGVWNATNQQDSDLVGYTQLGAENPAYRPGPYSPFTEGLVEAFCNWYVGRMKAGLEAR